MEQVAAYFFDGASSERRIARLDLRDKLEIYEGERLLAAWSYNEIRSVQAEGAGLRLRSLDGAELARLIILDGALAKSVAARCSMLHKDNASRGQVFRIVGWSLAAAASVVVLAFWGVPWAADLAATYAPHSVERQIGDIADKQFRTIFSGKVCAAPEGQAAFDKMMRTLGDAVGVRDVRGAILQSSVPNAVALPGGQVYLLSPMLDAANSADEIAGVMAHELGHVKHRDAMRRLAQVSASSFLLGTLFGDVTGAGVAVALAREVGDASYSRKAEYEADGVAIETLRKLQRPATPMGELMQRITGTQSAGAGSILASHPLTQDRLARMKKEDDRQMGPPILTDTEWKALKAACSNLPKLEKKKPGEKKKEPSESSSEPAQPI